MRSSDRHIPVAAARKTDPDVAEQHARQERQDTWPAPPPSSSRPADDTDKYDTIPTPPPESGTADVIVIPPLRGVSATDEERA
jgi:hypothetical protein